MSSITQLAPKMPTSAAQRARHIRLHAMASSRIVEQSHGQDQHLRRLLGHVAVLENVERQQNEDRQALNFMPTMSDSASQISTPLPEYEDEDDDDSSDDDDDDDEDSLTSDSSSDSEEDSDEESFPEFEMQNGAKSLRVRSPSQGQDDIFSQLEEMARSLSVAGKAPESGVVEMVEDRSKAGAPTSEVSVEEVGVEA